MENKDVYYMQIALMEAKKAKKKGEVPIGAVIIKNDKVIAKGYNNREKTQNAIKHAEINVISKACRKFHSWRLSDCEIYITLEPCLMCLGALLNSRIKRVVFGAYDNKKKYDEELYKNNSLNHNIEVIGGILEKECSNLLTNFFREKKD